MQVYKLVMAGWPPWHRGRCDAEDLNPSCGSTAGKPRDGEMGPPAGGQKVPGR